MKQSEIKNVADFIQYVRRHEYNMGEPPSAMELPKKLVDRLTREAKMFCKYPIVDYVTPSASEPKEMLMYLMGVRIISKGSDDHEQKETSDPVNRRYARDPRVGTPRPYPQRIP